MPNSTHEIGCHSSLPRCRRCYLPRALDASGLPVLSFRLEQHGRTLHLPLDKLLLPPDEDGEREFCVRATHETASIASCPVRCPATMPILMGSMVVQQYLAIFDMNPTRCAYQVLRSVSFLGSKNIAGIRTLPKDLPYCLLLSSLADTLQPCHLSSRVGLVPKQPSLSAEELMSRERSCNVKARCKGQQYYSAASNRCIEPDCYNRSALPNKHPYNMLSTSPSPNTITRPACAQPLLEPHRLPRTFSQPLPRPAL